MIVADPHWEPGGQLRVGGDAGGRSFAGLRATPSVLKALTTAATDAGPAGCPTTAATDAAPARWPPPHPATNAATNAIARAARTKMPAVSRSSDTRGSLHGSGQAFAFPSDPPALACASAPERRPSRPELGAATADAEGSNYGDGNHASRRWRTAGGRIHGLYNQPAPSSHTEDQLCFRVARPVVCDVQRCCREGRLRL